MGWDTLGRGTAAKTKKETVFQPNGNSCKIFLVQFLKKSLKVCPMIIFSTFPKNGWLM